MIIAVLSHIMETSQTALLDDESLFFCFGAPKSGTTFLQRTLNLHPDISCPAEHQFSYIIQGFEEILRKYQDVLTVIDRRTGGQGVPPLEKETAAAIIRFSIEMLIKQAAKNGEQILGANDNAIRKNLKLFDEIFEQPRMICIFRNPIDMAVSAWHHNRRLAKEENDPVHEKHMAQYGDFDDWIRQYARWFAEDVAAYRAFSAGRANIIRIRYEDFVADKRSVLIRLFEFLGADCGDDLLKSIEHESSLSHMREHSSNPAFFRRGATDMGSDEVSGRLHRDVAKIAGAALEFLGYDLTGRR